jgi:nitric oxide reductase subunit B
MTGALLVSGFVQAFVERAIGGSTLNAFISQENAWFVDGMVARFLLAIVFTAGYVALVWDVLTLGRRAPAVAAVAAAQ